MMNQDNPLTEQHLNIINQGLSHLQNAHQIMDVLHAAGEDVSIPRAAAHKCQHYLTTVKNAYFPRGSKSS